MDDVIDVFSRVAAVSCHTRTYYVEAVEEEILSYDSSLNLDHFLISNYRHMMQTLLRHCWITSKRTEAILPRNTRPWRVATTVAPHLCSKPVMEATST